MKATNLDLSVQRPLLVVKLIVVVWVHLQVVEGEFLLDSLLKSAALFQSQRIRLCNDWNDIDNIRKLLENNNINWLESMAGRLNEEEAAVDAGILDITLSLGCKLLSKVCGVLVLDVLDDWVPASVVVDLISIARGVNNIQAQSNAILLNDM
jgi:hypothetical protein